MKLRAAFILTVLLGVGWLAPSVGAHSPFDASVRVIVHADAAELNVTLGTALGEQYLRAAALPAGSLSAGHLFALPPGLLTNFFTVTDAETALVPRAASGITDGLEYEFHFEFALVPAAKLRLQARFLSALPSPRAVALVATDENGNLFGTAILAPGKEVAEFALPALAPAAAPVVAGDRLKVEGSELATRNLPPATPRPAPSFGEFLKLGLGHILNVEAFDHLLFLLALLLGCQRLKPMLLVITGFTLAHSLTLALAALNVITLSARVVEPLIAASILIVAAENFRKTEKSWPRYVLTAGFGLIHGFGFAGALRASGLAGAGWAVAQPLFAFNLGVELGQLTVAAIVLPLLLGLNRWPWFARHGARVISALVMLVASGWLWQRLMP
jgi:hypothetical protein